uniref:Envelope protein n=1 Tax=Cyclopterus lumpus TaxID=8103 RepID=A0A8C2Z1R4_CYCLU
MGGGGWGGGWGAKALKEPPSHWENSTAADPTNQTTYPTHFIDRVFRDAQTPPNSLRRLRRSGGSTSYNKLHNQFKETPQIKIRCVTGQLCAAVFDVCLAGGCPAASKILHYTVVRTNARSHKYLCTGNCGWADVFAHTNPNGYVNRAHEKYKVISLTTRLPQCANVAKPSWNGPQKINHCNEVTLTISNPQVEMAGYYTLGIDNSGFGDSMVRYLNISNIRQTIETETGFSDSNTWLNWLLYTAKDLQRPDCLVCANARPQLATVPFAVNPYNDAEGFQCMLGLFKNVIDADCTTLGLLFPAVPSVHPPTFTYYKGNYTCLLSTQGTNKVGTLTDCQITIDVTAGDNHITSSRVSDQNTARADVWWYCGDKKLRDYLPKTWTGTCALVRLIMPVTMIPLGQDSQELLNSKTPRNQGLLRRRRGLIATSFDRNVYIDSIGVPRGVPNEYKAQNQIAAGFESIFLWPTINKNVDWINYIHYNQQRFVNYTRDAVKGLMEQLDKTSLMAWQNRMALDMLLAEKGGVCKMFGSLCCTFIPNNTAPDGSVTRALAGLTSLTEELKENAGVKDLFTDMLENWFGKYKQLFLSIMATLAMMIVGLVLCGCCCIPCLRTLVARLITTALTKEDQPLMMPLVAREAEDPDRAEEQEHIDTYIDIDT